MNKKGKRKTEKLWFNIIKSKMKTADGYIYDVKDNTDAPIPRFRKNINDIYKHQKTYF